MLLNELSSMWEMQKGMHVLVKDILIALGKYIKQKKLPRVEEMQVTIFKTQVLLPNIERINKQIVD